MHAKTALIIDATGQDGACRSELLLGKGDVVHGRKRRSSSSNTGRVDRLYQDPHDADTRVFLLFGDLTAKARAGLGWQHRIGFDELVREMVEADLANALHEGGRNDVMGW